MIFSMARSSYDKYIRDATMFNFIKKSDLIFDGLETDFLNDKISRFCPLCDGDIEFGLYNSYDYDSIDKNIKKLIKIKGVAFSQDGFNELRYKNFPLRYTYCRCSHKNHNFLVVFSFGEMQPARYISYLLGIFER